MKWPKLIPELTVLDFNESYKFYVDVLGFEVENVRTNPNFAYLKLDEAHLMIEEHHEEGWNVGGLKYPLGLGLNFQIECNDAILLKHKLVKAGYEIYRGVKESWYNTGEEISGFKEFLVQDPSGYLLRFSQYLGKRAINPIYPS